MIELTGSDILANAMALVPELKRSSDAIEQARSIAAINAMLELRRRVPSLAEARRLWQSLQTS